MSRAPNDSDQEDGGSRRPNRRRRWLDGLTPEEQLAKIDKAEARAREIWANFPPGLAHAAIGDLDGNLGLLNMFRKRVRAGLPPLDFTEEEQAKYDRIEAEIAASKISRASQP